MSYNILNYPGSTSSIRNPDFQTVLSNIVPDIIVVQEILSQAGVNEFLNSVLNSISGDYTAGTFINGPDTDNAIFFKSSHFNFIANNVITTALRDINEFVLSENTTGDTIRIYSLHLKASTGSTNQQKRHNEVIALRNVTDTLPPNSDYIVCGDFNIYSANEPAYQELLDQSQQGYVIDIYDLPGTWNNPSYALYHTQSTRTRQFGGGATGGMDDRFDMILMSQAVMDSGGIFYEPNSFVNYGNDGNHYNDSINKPPNNAVGQIVADALHGASDHIPVYAHFSFNNQIPLTFQLTVSVVDDWNLVSVPGINPDGQLVETWWSAKNPEANVFKYSNGYQIITSTTPGEGYWMKHLGANIYNTGDEWPAGGIEKVSNTPIPAEAGWNLIGGYENTVLTSSLTTTPPGLISGPIYEYVDGYFVATNLKPGYAYWVKLTSSGSINIPIPTQNKYNTELVVDHFREDWGRITITDATGKSFTLYAVDGEANLESYEMPPMPPTDVFDVRYESNRIAEELMSEFKAIQMTAIVHPITVKVENMDIRLQDETGKLVDANLKSGEDITISNAQVSKLMVTGDMVPDVFAL
ncbi:MAG: hypothetical protein KJO59_00705, partial [Ignavibacteria bacterium]|nr:hypothetical protein [Ignavibacteria bacterium]